MLSMQMLAVMGAVVLLLIVLAPFYSLVLLDLVLIPVVEPWYIGDSLLDPSDIIIASIGLLILLRGRFSLPNLLKSIPYLIPWLLLGTFMCASYLAAPINADNLTNPARVGYQLFRYCWKLLLYYPICLMVLRNLRDTRIALLAVLIGADICAAQAVLQGYAGDFEPPGPFDTGNELAAVLIVPFMVALAGIIFPRSRLHWLFCGASFLLIVRAVLFSASRGGMVAMIAGAGILGGLAFLLPTGRRRIFRLAPLVALAPLILLMLRPDLLRRPTVQHAITLTEGHKTANMKWRIQERWPHFLGIAREHPLLGSGTHIDTSLSLKANTPHNGYIALAAKYGFVVTALFLFFLYRALWDSLKIYRDPSVPIEERLLFLTLAAAVAGLAVHNLVETTWIENIILKFFWMICATTAAYTHLWQSADSTQPKTQAKTSHPTPSNPRPSLTPA